MLSGKAEITLAGEVFTMIGRNRAAVARDETPSGPKRSSFVDRGGNLMEMVGNPLGLKMDNDPHIRHPRC